MKFVYIFSEADRDKLLKNGYRLLKSDEENHIYIFENSNDRQFDLGGNKYVLSDVLTF